MFLREMLNQSILIAQKNLLLESVSGGPGEGGFLQECGPRICNEEVSSMDLPPPCHSTASRGVGDVGQASPQLFDGYWVRGKLVVAGNHFFMVN